MFKNLIKTAFRTLVRNKVNSIINILGLAIGMAVTLLIVSYVFFELSYDKHNNNYQNIYRIYSHISLANGNTVEGPITAGEIGPLLQEQIPGIKKATRLMGYRHRDVILRDEVFTSSKLMWADSTYFDIFTHKFIAGNPSSALNEPYTVVITETIAKKLFGNEDAYHKILRIEGENYKISAIIEDIPINSHIQFEYLGSFASVQNEKRNAVEEGLFNFYTYLLCEKSVDFKSITEKADIAVAKKTEERIKGMGITTKSRLQALKDIHLKSQSFHELETGGDINNVYIFAVLAIFIIVIAIVNFVNLVTANSETRAKEIGLRKVMGAFHAQLFFQFIGEAIIISLIAFIIALGVAELFIASFRELMESPILLPYWENPILLIFILLGVITIGFISGSYPAIYLSRFSPSKALKGSKSSSTKNNLLRKLLVVFQFTIAIFLMINLALLYSQVSFMKNKDLGFDKEQVMVVEKLSKKTRSSYKSLKADLLMNPNIISVGAAQGVPGVEDITDAMYKSGEDIKSAIVMIANRVQVDYFKTLGIEIVEGRSFSDEIESDKKSVILNETAVKELGLVDPIHKKVIMVVDTLRVIGICKDFHFKSLHNPIEPIAHTFQSKYISHIVIKFNTKNLQSTIKSIEGIFKNADPNLVFSYSFMDQRFADMYQKEDRINKLITYTAILAIIISMLGLFALTSFTIRQKTQEIGIRKVMGASEGQVVKMFVINLTQWVLFAAIIAFPISYYSMNKWLDQFVFHANIKIWMFAFGGLLAFIIAASTVALISFKAARANPSESLKYE